MSTQSRLAPVLPEGVCIAMLLTKKMGRPSASIANGVIEPNGKPGKRWEWVDRLPIRPIEARVRERSARGRLGHVLARGSRGACCRVGTSQW
jgi:hypothetical protein